MPRITRRGVLTGAGVLVGGAAATVTAAASPNRYIVDTRATGGVPGGADVEVVRDLSAVDLAVVRGSESAVRSLGGSYAPDLDVSLNLPARETGPDAADEPGYDRQWDKRDQNVLDAHETTEGDGARVAIVDTGVAAGHPDLDHAVNGDLSRDFTGDGYGAPGPYGGYHGTHVAGIVAADGDNEAGVVGTAPDAEIVDCRVFSPESPASWGDILAAMLYAAEVDADVANLSLGAYPVSRRGYGRFYGKVLDRTTTEVTRRGTLLVVAAGNDAADLQHDGRVGVDTDGDGEVDEYVPAISVPNEAAGVLSVAATGPVGFNREPSGLAEPFHQPAKYTNYGTNAVDVAAPGGNYDPAFPEGWYYDMVYNSVATFENPAEPSGTPNYDYGWVAGTSMAAPAVSGTAALLASAYDGPSKPKPRRIRDAVERTAAVPDGYDRAYYGSGYLRTAEAVAEMADR